MCVFSADPLLLGNQLVCSSLRKPVSPTLSIPLCPVVLRVELGPCGLSLTTLAHLLIFLFSSCWVLLVGLYGWSFCDSFYRLPSLVDRVVSYWRLAPWDRFWEMQLADQEDNFQSFGQVLFMVCSAYIITKQLISGYQLILQWSTWKTRSGPAGGWSTRCQPCYGLNINCPPQTPMLEHFVPTWWGLFGMVMNSPSR